ncbi:hypothetical protein EVA_18302 [gut metagenome]|uniref:Uncharacterized protein n=1 Tax=gut metagenome TaxID=749906 RepID=J9G223_9ZZZZ
MLVFRMLIMLMIPIMTLTIRMITVIPAITVMTHSIVERTVIIRIRADADFHQHTSPAMTPITIVIITNIPHLSARSLGNLKSNTYISPISSAASVTVIQHSVRNTIFQTQPLSEIRQFYSGIPIRPTDEQRNAILSRQSRSQQQKEEQ